MFSSAGLHAGSGVLCSDALMHDHFDMCSAEVTALNSDNLGATWLLSFVCQFTIVCWTCLWCLC